MSIKLQQLLTNITKNISNIIGSLPQSTLYELEELRLRVNKPLIIYTRRGELFPLENGLTSNNIEKAYIVKEEDVSKTLELITGSSVYALGEEMKNGFITIEGGHRVGFCGRAAVIDGEVKSIKDIASLNFRMSHEVIGAADKIMPYITKDEIIHNTLIISPPGCGKTTLLRDIARQLSNGYGNLDGVKVAICDERSEIAACYNSLPQNDVGNRTDVLSGCPKPQGMRMLIRSMSPDVLITDEIGTEEDGDAINYAINAGVKIITSIHGYEMEDILRKKGIGELIRDMTFTRIIILNKKDGAGTVVKVIEND